MSKIKMNRGYKIRLFPTDDQIVLLNKTFGCVRFIYNAMLSDKIKHYEETGKRLNNCPSQYKKDNTFLSEIDSFALCNAQINLNTAYRNFFKGTADFPKFKKKHKSKQSYTTNNRESHHNIRIEPNNYLRLPKVGLIKFKKHREFPKNAIIKSCTITKRPSGKFEASILYEWYVDEPALVEVKSSLGLDYSSSHFYIDNNGNEANYPHFYRKSESKLALEQRKLSKMMRDSNNYKKQKQRVAKLQEHTANQRKDFLHKLSTEIANQYDLVCVEDLDLHAQAQSLNFGKAVGDNGFGMFRTFLEYKLSERGKYFIKVDKFFASTKTCHCCGYKNNTLTLKDREWTCPNCNSHHDRDVNAAINIKNEGLRLLGVA